MSNPETYPQGDFSPDEIFPAYLMELANYDGLGCTNVQNNPIDSLGDVVFHFSTALTSPQQDTLDDIVTNYDGIPPQDAYPMEEYYAQVQGFFPTWVAVDNVSISPGRISHPDGGFIQSDSSLSADFDVGGAGGIDSGANDFSANESVYGWVIDGPTKSTKFMFSNHPTSVVMPTGYDRKCRVFAGKLTDDTDLMCFICCGEGRLRHYTYSEERSTHLRVISAGGPSAWTTVTCNTEVPSTIVKMQFTVQGNTTGVWYMRHYGNVSTYGEYALTNYGDQPVYMPCDSARKFDYKVPSSGTVSIDVIGFTDQI